MRRAIKRSLKKALRVPVLQIARKVLGPEEQLADQFSRHFHESNGVLPCCISYNQYGAYCVPLFARHRQAARRILAGEVYEPQTIQFITSHCGDGDIIHAGTFFGDFIPALSKACAPGRNVWCFEPNPESHRCAAITIAINGLQNVCLTHAGLGDQGGSLRLKVRDDEGGALGGASSFLTADDGSPHCVEVKVVTIDQVVPSDRHVTILQLDVEGFEQFALAGAMQTITRCRPAIVLESAPPPQWIQANLQPLGYTQIAQVHRNTVYAPRP